MYCVLFAQTHIKHENVKPTAQAFRKTRKGNETASPFLLTHGALVCSYTFSISAPGSVLCRVENIGREWNPDLLSWSFIFSFVSKLFQSTSSPLIFIYFYFHWQAGRQGREKFGSKKATKKRLNQFASTSNKVKTFLHWSVTQICQWKRLTSLLLEG